MVADRLGGATLEEWRERMSLREFLQWAAQFKLEAEQRNRADQQQGRAGR